MPPTYNPPVVAGSENSPGFQAVGGDILNQAVVSQYDIYSPFEWMQLMARHGKRPGFAQVLDAMGYSSSAKNPKNGHYELPWQENQVTIFNIETAAGAAGAVMEVSLSAGEMFDPGVLVNGVAAEASFVQENDEILLPSGNLAVVKEIDYTASPWVITLRPKDGTVDLDDLVTEGESYSVLMNNFPEGGSMPKGRTPQFIHYENTFQITKETWSVTGSEATNELYFSVKQVNGSIVIVAEMVALQAWENKKSNLLLWGEQNTNDPEFNTNLGFDTNDTGTEGYLRFSETYGLPFTYTPGAFNITDFDVYKETFELEKIPFSEFLFGGGIKILGEITSELYNNNIESNAQFVYDMLGGSTPMDGDPYQFNDAGMYSVKIGFNSFQKDGYTFMFRTFHEFNAIHQGGGAAYNYNQRAYISPLGFNKDRKSDVQVATIGYEWKELNGISRKNNMSYEVGAGTTNGGLVSSPKDIRHTYMLAEMAFHGSCANQMGYVLPV